MTFDDLDAAAANRARIAAEKTKQAGCSYLGRPRRRDDRSKNFHKGVLPPFFIKDKPLEREIFVNGQIYKIGIK